MTLDNSNIIIDSHPTTSPVPTGFEGLIKVFTLLVQKFDFVDSLNRVLLKVNFVLFKGECLYIPILILYSWQHEKELSICANGSRPEISLLIIIFSPFELVFWSAWSLPLWLWIYGLSGLLVNNDEGLIWEVFSPTDQVLSIHLHSDSFPLLCIWVDKRARLCIVSISSLALRYSTLFSPVVVVLSISDHLVATLCTIGVGELDCALDMGLILNLVFCGVSSSTQSWLSQLLTLLA